VDDSNAEDSTSLGEQHGLIVPLVALRTPDQAAQFSQTGGLELGGNVRRRVEVSLKVDLVTEPEVVPRHVPGTFAGLATDEQVATRA
jgi:hypothetical protein